MWLLQHPLWNILSLQVLVTHWTSHSIIHKLFTMKVQPLCCWIENTILSHEQLAVYRADVTAEIDHQQFRLKLWDQNKRLVRRNEAGLHLTQNTTVSARVQAVSTTPVCVGAWHDVLTRWDVMFLFTFKRTKSQPIKCFSQSLWVELPSNLTWRDLMDSTCLVTCRSDS